MNEVPEILQIACQNVMAQHGIACHYTITTKMVKNQYPEVGATDARVLYALSANPYVFDKLSPGVYFLAGKREGRTYPEMVEELP